MVADIGTAATDVEVGAEPGARPAAWVRFPYDRTLVRGFRAAFPRARWREDRWVVPGVRARARLDAWAAQAQAAIPRHGDARGRDALAFDPIQSPLVSEEDDALVVRTPYDRAIVAALRRVPFAGWDPEARAWRVPLRSVEDLRRELPGIEAAAAARAERERRRAAGKPDPPPDPAERLRASARRRRRYPVPVADPPPADAPVATRLGIVVFTETGGELVEAEVAPAFPFVAGGDHVWASWRPPTWRELRRLRGASADPLGERRGWWRPRDEDIDAGIDAARRRRWR